MNIFFISQSGSLKMFHRLLISLKEKININNVGFYVTDSFNYYIYRKENTNFIEQDFEIVKEWEIINNSKFKKVDSKILKEYSNILEGFNIWDSITSDRFLYYGKKCNLYQNYQPRFNEQELNSILQTALTKIHKTIIKLSPDIILGYNCITFGETLFYFFAKSLKIKYANLRSLKLQNYVCYGDSIHKSIKPINNIYKQYQKTQKEDRFILEAEKFINQSKNKRVKYEGVRQNNKKEAIFKKNFVKIIKNVTKSEYIYWAKAGRKDNQCSSPLLSLIYLKVFNRIRARFIDFSLTHKYVKISELNSIKYAFFPLHSEPEVSLMLHNKVYNNQIEVIRLFTNCLPTGYKLVVKDHPVSIGKRSYNYYKKIINIPNVRLIHHSVNTKDIIQQSELLVTVAGSVSFEAILLAKPVISLGKDHHDILPDSMIKIIDDPKTIYYEIIKIIKDYKYKENYLKYYIASVMKISKKIDLYSSLLGRPNRYKINQRGDNQFRKNIKELRDFTLEIINLDPEGEKKC